MLNKVASFALILLSLTLLTYRHVHAQEADFDTTYNIEYSVDNSLVVSVKEDIAIINQTAGSVPSSFIETITNISIYDIKVTDVKSKEIQPDVTVRAGQKETSITIPIENPAVGKDKKTQITLYYKTKDLAAKAGRILNLHIPRAPVSNFMQEYNVYIKIPKDFGPQLSITPKPIQEKMEEEGYTLIYNKQTLENYGISASFGDYQIFDFLFNLQLKNESVFSKSMEVALPMPVNNYQEIALTKVEPKPQRLTKDIDGNIIATYKVNGNKTMDVIVTGKAKVYTQKTSSNSTQYTEGLPYQLKIYTLSKPFWEKNAREITDLAQSLYNKDESYTKNALAIYSYLINNLTYDFEGAKTGGAVIRKGASQTLKDKKGLCLDFSDLFIALARSVGIPAREVDGYAYARDLTSTPVAQTINNGNVLHSWVQYYDPQTGWVSIDPTWGATSGLDFFSRLDNNHIAFVIKGADSSYPQPPTTFTVSFSNDDYFSKESLYNLETLPQKKMLELRPWMIITFVLGLGLCTTAVVVRIGSKDHYK